MKSRIRFTSMTQTVGDNTQNLLEVEFEIDHETGITPEQLQELDKFFKGTEENMLAIGLGDF